MRDVSVSQSVALMSSTEVHLVRQRRVALANNMAARGFCRLEMIGTTVPRPKNTNANAEMRSPVDKPQAKKTERNDMERRRAGVSIQR